MKNLIVYYSFTRNNEKLAEHLRDRLNCEIVKLETVKKRNGFSILFDLMFSRKPRLKPVTVSLRDYDHVIFVAPIWAGKIAMPLTSFLSDQKQNIRSYAFATLCGGGNVNQKENVRQELLSIVQKAPLNMLELWINDLLTEDKKNTIKYTSGFRIEDEGLDKFENKIRDFLKEDELIRAV